MVVGLSIVKWRSDEILGYLDKKKTKGFDTSTENIRLNIRDLR